VVVEVHTHIGTVDALGIFLARYEGAAPSVVVQADGHLWAANLQPADARRLAVLLCQAADRADGYPTVVRDVSRDAIDQRGEPLGPPQRHSDSLEWISKGGLP
jgi:hypothetical protein